MALYDPSRLRDHQLEWVAVRTRARAEKQVARVLDRCGIQSWSPTAPIRRKWSDRWKVIDWPLFPCYVFARVPTNHWYPLLDVGGVFTVVKRGYEAAPIADGDIENLRRFADRLGGVGDEEPQHEDFWFTPGDQVMITEGPLAGVAGVVTRAEGRTRVTVGLTLLSRGVSVRLPVTGVVRVVDDAPAQPAPEPNAIPDPLRERLEHWPVGV